MLAEKDDRIRAVILALGLASVLCCGMALIRMLYSSRGTYLFFCWNLFLAWIPLGLSIVLFKRQQQGRLRKRISSWAIGAAWLAFFPNAPYIITDIIHLRPRSPVPLWYDAILVFAFAFTGLGLAFISLLLVHGLVQRWRGSRAGWIFVAAVAGLTGFGVYLGRFQRWNSWDLVTRPDDLLASAFHNLLHPTSHPHSIGVTVIFGGFFAIAYLILFTLTGLRPHSKPKTENQDPPASTV
jgi:uncharacterized membrane protein